MHDDSEKYPTSQYVQRMPDLFYNTIGTEIREKIGVCNIRLIAKEKLEIQCRHPALDLAVLNLLRFQNQFFLLLVVQSVFMFTTIYFQEKLKKT